MYPQHFLETQVQFSRQFTPPRHFVVFDVTVNEVIFFASFSGVLFLVYIICKNVYTQAHTLPKINLFLYVNFIFCNCTYFFLVTSFIEFGNQSHSFSAQSLGFLICKIMLSAINDNCNSSFPILMPFLLLSCLLTLARTSSIILIESSESGYCLVFDLRNTNTYE